MSSISVVISTLHAVRRCLQRLQRLERFERFERFERSPYSTASGGKDASRRRKLLSALHAAVTNDGVLHDGIVKEAGISFQDVRLSKDGSKAFVLWSSWRDDGDPSVAARALVEHTSRLKQVVSRALKSRRTPYLEFVSALDEGLAAKREGVDELLRRLDAVGDGRREG